MPVEFVPDDAPPHVCISLVPHLRDFTSPHRVVDAPEGPEGMAGNAPFDGPSGATGQVDARQQYVIESQQFHEGSAVAVGCGGDLYVVLPEIVQHLVDVCHFALAGNLAGAALRRVRKGGAGA